MDTHEYIMSHKREALRNVHKIKVKESSVWVSHKKDNLQKLPAGDLLTRMRDKSAGRRTAPIRKDNERAQCQYGQRGVGRWLLKWLGFSL